MPARHRIVVYKVHGCPTDSPCRCRPECESPDWSGFVEGKALRMLGRHATEADAQVEAARIASDEFLDEHIKIINVEMP